MSSYHEFFDKWTLQEYLDDETREMIAGKEFEDLKTKARNFEEQGYVLLHIRTKGGICFKIDKKPVILHRAKMFAYRTYNGDVYAQIFVIPVIRRTTDADSREIYESVSEDGEAVYFVIDHIPGDPASLDQVYLMPPHF